MDVTPFCTPHEISIPNASVVFDPKVRGYCNMGAGCPNFNKGLLCPPKSKYRPGFSKSGELHLAWVEFNIDAYAEAFAGLDEKHARMSQGQLRNSRLWQASINSKLSAFIENKWFSWSIVDL